MNVDNIPHNTVSPHNIVMDLNNVMVQVFEEKQNKTQHDIF
jgi:hypothetical protein